ncbi:MAG: hypothetical protein KKD11_08620, partial [Candidatus Omnitrophica bacterium]|nr:hypothetical protein [Candidatus Omnitrophota bacterium]
LKERILTTIKGGTRSYGVLGAKAALELNIVSEKDIKKALIESMRKGRSSAGRFAAIYTLLSLFREKLGDLQFQEMYLPCRALLTAS